MTLKDAKRAAVFKKTVLLGLRLGQATDDAAWIELREPTFDEALAMREAVTEQETTCRVMAQCIVDHNIQDEAGGLAKPEDIVAMLRQSATLFGHVTSVWVESLPLPKRSATS